jgi:hypothetical protein
MGYIIYITKENDMNEFEDEEILWRTWGDQ